MTYEVIVSGRTVHVAITRGEQGFTVTVDGTPVDLDVSTTSGGTVSLLLEGKSYEVRHDKSNGQISVNGRRFDVEVRDPRSLRARRSAAGSEAGPRKITAPMPGKVVRILAAAGAEVEASQGMIVIEAMKMQNELKSPKKGRVQKMLAAEGATVNAGDTLAIVE
jgi:biotin carboxyl carrier protein